MSKNIVALAHTVLAQKQLGISDAMIQIIGPFTDKTANTHQAVFEEIQNIQQSKSPVIIED